MPSRILVVDDDPAVLRVISSILKAAHYEVYTAPDGQKGLAAAGKIRPDLTILDLNMPVMDGATMAAAMRDNPSLKKTPIIFLTGLVQENELGASTPSVKNEAYIAKPFDPQALIDLVREMTDAPDNPV